MKFLHISDLHLGKRVNEFSMLEDQEYILAQIVRLVEEEAPDGVLIAGDVYDKSSPSAEAVCLFDKFLVQLVERKTQVFVISGNHDSPERIAFGARLVEGSGVHLSRVYDGEVKPITMQDEHGTLNVYLLPFIKPVHVRKALKNEEISNYTEAVKAAVEAMHADFSARNILVTHQFVTGASRSESEELSVGGTDNVDVAVFEGFDYVALGHIHGPQNCSSERVRYCGTPLKYSFSEAAHKKSVTAVEFGKKGEFSMRTLPLEPKREMREIRGTYEELTSRSFYENTTYCEDYMHVTLTDEEDIPDAIAKLRVIYRNLMKLDYDNARTRANMQITGATEVENKTPSEHFADFYELQNNRAMSEEQAAFMRALIQSTWEENV